MGERAQAEVAERVGHTPGPWEAGLSHGRGVLCVTADDGCTWICGELLNEHEPISGTEAKANAHLIAAAPDMLAALKSLHADCVEYALINNLHNSDGSPATHHSMRLALAAIAKAEGH